MLVTAPERGSGASPGVRAWLRRGFLAFVYGSLVVVAAAASAALAALAVLPPLAVLAELGLLDGEARLCRELQRRRVEALRALDLLFAAEVLELLRGLAADRPPPGLD